MRSKVLISALFLLALQAACDEPRQAQPVPQADPPATSVAVNEAPAPTADGAQAIPDPAAVQEAAPEDPNRPVGTVAEQKYTADYTFLRLETADKKEVWLAAARFRGTIGDKVYLPDPSKDLLMKNFASKTLNRTFEEIYFVNEIMRPGDPRAVPSEAPASAPASQAASAPAAPPIDVKALEEKAEAEGLPGKVIEVLQVDEYSYLKVNTGFKEAWVAATKVDAKAGDKVMVKGGVLMSNFHSKTLNRTFEEIYFANDVRVTP